MPTSNLVPGYPAINQPREPQVAGGSDGAYLGGVPAYAGYATGTVTIAGTTTTGNTITTTINGHAVTYTLISGDTTNTLVATHLAAAINADSTDSGIVTATSSGAVVTITANAQGSSGQYSLSTSVTGTNTATASDTRLGFANNVYIAKTTFSWRIHTGAKTYYKGVAYVIDPTNAALMRTAGYLF